MESIRVPGEEEIKRWVKEVMEETLSRWIQVLKDSQPDTHVGNEPLLSRRDAARLLGISLVTLHDWVKHGLKNHKKHGRVYFLRSEIMEYLQILSKDSRPAGN